MLQVSLEDTLQDEAPKLDPITAVYMVGKPLVQLEEKQQKQNFAQQDLSVISLPTGYS